MIGKDWVFGREKRFFERETLDRLRKDLRRVLFSLLFFPFLFHVAVQSFRSPALINEKILNPFL